MKLPEILGELGLSKYEPLFEQHAIGDDLLPSLTSDDLREIGVTPLGHRKKILAAIEDLAGRKDTAAEQGEIQYRLVTVLFADLVGSTQLSQALNSEQLRELTRAYQAVAKDAIERYEGFVAQYLGDGILAYFGYPQSHEDDTERAVRAALDLLTGLKETPTVYAERLGVEVNARVGIESGQVVVGGQPDQDQAAVGETPNLAARLQSEAAPDTVVIGPGTKALLPNHVQIRGLGSRRLKGFVRDIEIWQVLGVGFGLDRIEDRIRGSKRLFVGRDRELMAIEAALSLTRKGEPATIHVIGEPGIGKSRLVHEFLQRAPKSTRVLDASCPHFGAPALHPFSQILKTRAGSKTRNSVHILSDDIQQIDKTLHRELPYLLRLAGFETRDTMIDPDTMAVKTHQALIRWITATGKTLPTILFINNVHWIDERSEAVIRDLVAARPRGILILCTFRPDYAPPWAAYPSVRSLPLEPLNEMACNALYRELGGAVTEVGLQIAEKSGGNPLFIEELALHARQRANSKDRDIRTAIPSSLSGLLLQRVDRL